jgi:tetratricopeptide (TPR) repeat protein
MDQIHNTLASIGELKIISTISSNNYLNSNKTLSKIADELHVKYLINGSVLQINKDVKITVNLISGIEEKVIWTKNSEGKTDDIFKLMNTISKEVVEEFNKKLNHNIEKNLNKIPTKSLAAFNEYLQGKQLVKTRNKEKLEAGIIKLDNAIEFDPTFADAYSERANAYWLIADGGYSDIEQADKMAEKNALMAIRLDSENSLAYGTLANIYRSQNKWEQANTTYQIALKYNPNHALNNYWYSLMLRTLGQINEAIKYSTKATELDPLYEVIMAGHMVNCIYGNRLDLAKKYIENNKLLLNENWTYYWVKGIYKIKIGDFSDALKELEYAHKLNPKVKAINNQILYCKAKMGNLTEVNKFLGQVPDLPINYSTLAIVYAGLGDKEKAMTFIQKNADLGNIPTDIKISPFFKILHNDIRFEAILQKFGLSENNKIALK